MAMMSRVLIYLTAIAMVPVVSCRAASPDAIFAQAGRQDLGGHAHLAFLLYQRAAKAGLPDAEFNVAIMLDSGRGATADIARAATWYARAASHGNHRAAYNLGQLYEAGEGVPKNIDLAHAWFAASGLPAARARLAATRYSGTKASILSPPTLVAPDAGSKSVPRANGVELVWTAPAQSEPVRYRVDVQTLDAGAHSVVSASVETSSLFAPLPSGSGPYRWRVVAVGRQTGKDAASDWQTFQRADE